MKKLLKWASLGAVAALLFSPLSYAQSTTITTMPPPETTITIEKAPSTSSSGFKVCYMPSTRHVEGSRMVQRCGNFGCQNFRVTRDFDIKIYQDCHLEKSSCPRGYKSFGWYPNKSQAMDAVDRCQTTITSMDNSSLPGGWKITY